MQSIYVKWPFGDGQVVSGANFRGIWSRLLTVDGDLLPPASEVAVSVPITRWYLVVCVNYVCF